MTTPPAQTCKPPRPSVLVVDDDQFAHTCLSRLLSSKYEVTVAESGPEALSLLGTAKPDLILIEADLPGIDGYETCRRIREQSNVPIIFVSGSDQVEALLQAFDSGGDDYVTKPFNDRVLARKVDLAIEVGTERKRLLLERAQEKALTHTLLSAMGESAMLLKFMKDILKCNDFHSLTSKITETVAEFGLHCCVQIRHEFLTLTHATRGEATPMEISVMNHVLKMGRIVQFKKRMAVNFDNLSIVIMNMPEDEEQCGRIRDNLVILCDGAQALVDYIGKQFSALHEKEDIMGESAKAHDCLVELKELQLNYQTSIQVLLHDFINHVETEYQAMDLVADQEHRISSLMGKIVGKMFDVFHENGQEFSLKTDEIMAILIPDRGNAVELF